MYEELYNLGLEKARQGDLAGAIKEFSRALKVNPQFSDAYYKRAVTRFDFGDLQGAIEDYKEVLQMHPDHINAYCGRGLTNLALGNMEAAIEDATQATRINPKQAQAYSLRGTACQRLGNVQAAIANFKKAAEIYLEQKDAVKCRQCIETIKKLQNAENQTKNPPFNPEEFINEALKKSISGDYGGAIGDLDWVIQLNPQEDKAYFHRGLIYARLESNWSAIEDFNQTIRLKSDYAEAYYHRGIARSATGDYASAIADLNYAANLFLEQRNIASYQQALSDIKKVEASQQYRNRIRAKQAYLSRDIPRGRPSFRVQQRLMILVGGHWDTAWRLVDLEREKNPGMPEDWYWEKAIYNIERDRGLK